ncbi:MAG: ATP-dependent metallopeptidase FtsH/Yme1/Tma family protein, partial [Bacteroidales bacterium]
MTEEKNQKNKKPSNLPKGKLPKGKFNFYWIYGIVAVIFIALTFSNYGTSTKEADWGELKNMLAAQDIEKIIVVNREEAEIFLKQEALSDSQYEDVKDSGLNGTGPHYIYTIGSYDSFKEDVESAQEGLAEKIYIKNVNRHNWSGEVLSWILPLVILIVVWVVIMRMMSRGGGGGGQIFSIGKSKAQLYDKETAVNVNFTDVAGLEEAKVEVMEIVDF